MDLDLSGISDYYLFTVEIEFHEDAEGKIYLTYEGIRLEHIWDNEQLDKWDSISVEIWSIRSVEDFDGDYRLAWEYDAIVALDKWFDLEAAGKCVLPVIDNYYLLLVNDYKPYMGAPHQGYLD